MLAGKQGSIFVAHVWVLHIGGVGPIGRRGSVHTVSGRIVDGLPSVLVDIFWIRNLVILQGPCVVCLPSSFEGDAGFTGSSSLGRNENNPVGAPRPIHRCRSGIL